MSTSTSYCNQQHGRVRQGTWGLDHLHRTPIFVFVETISTILVQKIKLELLIIDMTTCIAFSALPPNRKLSFHCMDYTQFNSAHWLVGWLAGWLVVASTNESYYSWLANQVHLADSHAIQNTTHINSIHQFD